MHFKLILLLTCLPLFFACNSSKERPVIKERSLEPISPDAAKWDNFWKSFTTAISQKDLEQVASMTKLPLPSNADDDGLSKATLAAQFSDLFDEKTAAKFLSATDRDFRAMPSNEQTAAFMKTPLGIELKVFNVAVEKGKDDKTGSSKVFVFGELDGQYKLLALMLAG